MSAFLYFLIWAAAIFVMMRFGCGSHVMGHGHGKAEQGGEGPKCPEAGTLRWIPPAEDVDPVCGKTVSTATAKPSVYEGSVYYFCSRECREVFEAASEQYVGPAAQGPPLRLENSHA
jgi:YHS domain-containing protein